jgi:hypothetical protein
METIIKLTPRNYILLRYAIKNSFRNALIPNNIHIPNLINEITTSYIFQLYQAVVSNIFPISKSTLSSTDMILGRHSK